MVISQMAALTTQSQLTAASTAATSSIVAAAIQQLNTNQQVMNIIQQAMMQHLMTYANADTTHNPPAVHNTPLTHFNIPIIGTFQPGGNAQGGRRPGCGRGGRAPVHVPGGRQAPHTPFTDYSVRLAGMGMILDVNGDPKLDATGNPTYVPVSALNRTTQATIDADCVLR